MKNDFKNLNNHLSNERTFLSELRTSLAFVSFGITLNRFSLYLLQSEKEKPRGMRLLNQGAYTGAGMVFLGLFLLVWAVYRYRRVLNAILQENYEPSTGAYSIIASVLIGISIVGAVWMILD